MRIFFVTLTLCHFFVSGLSQVRNVQNAVVTVPVDLTTKRPIIKVNIGNKGPFTFIFDTGSTGNVIDQKLVNELSLKQVGQDTLGTPGSSEKLIVPRVAVHDVKFDGSSFSQDAEMSVIDLRKLLPVDGILTGLFFQDYLVMVDYPGSSLTLIKSELRENEIGVIKYGPSSNLIIEVDGKREAAHLDSGSPGGFALPYDWSSRLNFEAEPQEDGTIRTPAATFKKWKAKLVGEIRVGSVVFKNPNVLLVENFEFVNLGYDVIKDLRLTMDYKNNLIRFEQSGIPSSSQREHLAEFNMANEFTGWYGGKVRKVFMEDGEMYLQRGNAPKLKLEFIRKDYYKMTISLPITNELPEVRFERNENGSVTGMTFISRDGEEFIIKD